MGATIALGLLVAFVVVLIVAHYRQPKRTPSIWDGRGT